MKKLIAAILIAVLACGTMHAKPKDDFKEPAPHVMADLNKPLEPVKPTKISTGSWIFIGVVVILAAVFGSMASNGTTSVNTSGK